MGEAKRRKDAEGTDTGVVNVTVRARIVDGAIQSKPQVAHNLVNWLGAVLLLSDALSIAILEHTKQVHEASQQMVVKPTGEDIARLS